MSASYPVMSDLSLKEQAELTRIAAIASASRNATDTAFYAAKSVHYTNRIIETDSDGNILRCSGLTMPVNNQAGFAKEAIFIKTDAVAGTAGNYHNRGTTALCEFVIMEADPTMTAAALAAGSLGVSIPEGTPVNAVAASSVLTMSGVITPGSHAISTLTSDTTEVADGDTVTIGTTVYRFKNTPDQAFDVKRTGTAATTLDMLKLAINASGTGDGTDYFAGTTAHPTVYATTNNDTTQVIQARIPGIAANTVATTTTATHVAWPGLTMNSGTPGVATETVTVGGVTYAFVDALTETSGAAAIANQVLFGADTAAALDNLKLAINAGATIGTNYSTGTVVHPTVTATTNSNTEQTVAAKTKGTAGNSITTSENTANGAWGTDTAHLTGGVNGTIGVEGQMLQDDDYLYQCIAANGITDTNWRRFTVGSVF